MIYVSEAVKHATYGVVLNCASVGERDSGVNFVGVEAVLPTLCSKQLSDADEFER